MKHGGQCESLVPPHTRGSLYLFLSALAIEVRRTAFTICFQFVFNFKLRRYGKGAAVVAELKALTRSVNGVERRQGPSHSFPFKRNCQHLSVVPCGQLVSCV